MIYVRYGPCATITRDEEEAIKLIDSLVWENYKNGVPVDSKLLDIKELDEETLVILEEDDVKITQIEFNEEFEV